MCGGAGQEPGSAGSFPGAGNGLVPFGSDEEHTGSFSYVHRGLHPPAPSPAVPDGQLTKAGLGTGRRCAGCGQGQRRRGGSRAAVVFPYGEVA